MGYLAAVVVVFCLSGSVHAYPNGPPVGTNPEICTNMMPQHGVGVTAQTTEAPYKVEVITSCYKTSMDITVYIFVDTTQDKWKYFEGLFVQAREVGAPITENIGTFEFDDDEDDLQTLHCFNKTDSAIGHNKKEHWGCKSFTWKIEDPAFQEDIQFQATLVKNTETFWIDVRSETISYNTTCSVDSDKMKDMDDKCEMAECTDCTTGMTTTSGAPGLRYVMAVLMAMCILAFIL